MSIKENVLSLPLSNSLILLLGFLWFALPLASEARVILFDAFALWVCIKHSKVLAQTPQVKQILLLFVIYQGMMLVSTLAHGLPLINLVRRSYAVILLILEGLALYCLFARLNDRRLLLLIIGIMLGICMHYFYPSDGRVKELPLKFLIGIPIGVLLAATLIAVVERPKALGKIIITTVLFGYSIFCVFHGSRATAGVFFVAGLFAWAKFDFARNLKYQRRFPIYLLIGVGGLYLLIESYTSLAIISLFGELNREIALFQSEIFGNILLGGRPEIVVNIIAFFDSPLIGHGPISEDAKYLNLLSSIGVYSEDLVFGNPESMYHSMLFATGQEGGVLPIFFWIFIIYKIAFAIPIMISTRRKVSYAATPLFIAGIWHVCFSPLIPYNRWFVALAIGFAFIANDERAIWIRGRRLFFTPKRRKCSAPKTIAHA